MSKQSNWKLLVLSVFGITFAAFASNAPSCLDRGQQVDIDNQQVLDWKGSTPNQFTARAHIQGTVTKLYPDHSGHLHFQATIGDRPGDTLEVIFNGEFGAKPHPRVGQEVEACGDYITSTKATQYPISPDHGLIHWIHENPRHHGHPDGFLMLDGQLYGFRNSQHRRN